MHKYFRWSLIALLFGGLVCLPQSALAGEPVSTEQLLLMINNVWMLMATFLVFMMHLGFSCVESGLTRSKNTVNILFKNLMMVVIGLLTFAAFGFNLMYPGGEPGGFLGFGGLGLQIPENGTTPEYHAATYTYWTDFLFQGMFAATAATIVSGAVAERVRLSSFLVFSALYVATVYPIFGSWVWGGGWLSVGDHPFHDFAGSTVVHSVGGWAALAGILVLGPRMGKYFGDEVRSIPGHSMPLAAIGVLLLWFGWYGFNGGSVLSADPGKISLVCVTTSLAGAAGVAAATGTSWVFQGKPDLSMSLNGALAGLVGITAGADVMTTSASILIGGISGILVVAAVLALDKAKIDDPVGAVSVHLICGVWGTLAVGMFGQGQDFGAQLKGVLAAAVFCFPAALGLFYGLKITMGLRVSEEEERSGLDISEHGMESYGGFSVINLP